MDSINAFLCGGSKASDFCYTYDAKGRKQYFSRRTGHRVAATNMPKTVKKEDIEERPEILNKEKLVSLKVSLLDQKKKLEEKIAEIERDLQGFDTEAFEKAAKAEQSKVDEAKQRQKEERKRFFEKIYKDFEETKKYQEKKPQSNPPPAKKPKTTETSQEFLKTLAIHTKSEWKKWLLKNHPDKGGKDEELCKKVISAGRDLGW